MGTMVRPRSWGTIKPPVGAQVNTGHPLARGLAGAFLLNEQGGPRLNDVANAAKGTTQGVATTPQWGYGGIFVNNATANAFVFPAGAYEFSGRMSVVAQVFPITLTGDIACTCLSSDSNQRNYGLDLNNAGGPRFYVQPSANNFDVASAASGTVPAKVWSQQAGTWDGSNAYLFVNGRQVASVASSHASINVVGQLAFGQLGGNSPASELFTGYIGSVFFWNRALQPSEIVWLAVEPYAFILPPGPRALTVNTSVPVYIPPRWDIAHPSNVYRM